MSFVLSQCVIVNTVDIKFYTMSPRAFVFLSNVVVIDWEMCKLGGVPCQGRIVTRLYRIRQNKGNNASHLETWQFRLLTLAGWDFFLRIWQLQWPFLVAMVSPLPLTSQLAQILNNFVCYS